MEKKLQIKEVAKERGITLSDIAKKLKIPRSNMSAIASGSRGVSLKVLFKICSFLDCNIEELFFSERNPAIFKDKKSQKLLETIENQNYNGIDKTWVDRVMLAQKMHYSAVHRGVW